MDLVLKYFHFTAQRPELIPKLAQNEPYAPAISPDQQQYAETAQPTQPPYPTPPVPQLSFRSPNGQFAPIWAPAGVAFAVPAPAPSNGIAYYAPNTASQNYGPQEYTSAAGGAPPPTRRPPVLLVGNFPPSATVRPTSNPFAAYQVHSHPFYKIAFI